MKKYLLFLSVVTTGLVGCNDVLDQVPLSDITSQNFWQTARDAETGLTAVYDGLQFALAGTLTAGAPNFTFWGEARADVTEINAATSNQRELVQNTLSASSPGTDWGSLYTVINRANFVLTKTPQITDVRLTGTRRLQIEGEARFMRALSYFYAVRTWGDVPFYTKPFESASQDFRLPRTVQAVVLDSIENDALRAVATLPLATAAPTAANRGRATQGAARALLADVYLWRRKYQPAVDAINALIASNVYSLVTASNYGTLFTKPGNTAESIFELQFDVAQQELNGLINTYSIAGFGGRNPLPPSTKLIAAWPPASVTTTDVRRDVTLPIFNNQMVVGKYLGSPASGVLRNSDSNVILYRLADLYLLRAEAYNRLGNTTAATADLNLIRRRANNLSLTATARQVVDYPTAAETAARTTLEDAILQERFLELCFEGKRWFDLVRNDAVLRTLPTIKDPRNIVWPIAVNNLIQNPNLVQNEYYR